MRTRFPCKTLPWNELMSDRIFHHALYVLVARSPVLAILDRLNRELGLNKLAKFPFWDLVSSEDMTAATEPSTSLERSNLPTV